MEQTTRRFILFILVLFGAGILQFLGVGAWGAIPNFILVAIAAAALFLRDIWHELFLVALAAFLLKSSPHVERDIFAFLVVGLFAIVVQRRLPWHMFINDMFLVVTSTALLYAFIEPTAINSLMFVRELGYNIFVASVLYYGLSSIRLFRGNR